MDSLDKIELGIEILKVCDRDFIKCKGQRIAKIATETYRRQQSKKCAKTTRAAKKKPKFLRLNISYLYKTDLFLSSVAPFTEK